MTVYLLYDEVRCPLIPCEGPIDTVGVFLSEEKAMAEQLFRNTESAKDYPVGHDMREQWVVRALVVVEG